jgi:AsmA family
MRALRLLAAATTVLLVLLVAAAWLVPPRLDWGRTRDGIAALATQVLGRPVHISGSVSLDLLPSPTLTATGITMEDAGDGLSITAADLRLRVALTALLSGRIVPQELVLQHPLLRVPFPFSPGALARRPPWLRGLAARIEDGQLDIGGLHITGVAGSFAPDPATGVLSATAQGMVLGGTWHATAQLGMPGADGAAPLQLALDGAGDLAGTGASFNGRIGADGMISGQVTGQGPDLSRLLPAPKLAWQGEGRLTVTGGLAAADGLQLRIGGMPAQGAVAFRLSPVPRLDLALAANRLDLDAWGGLFLAGPPPPLLPGLAASLDLSADAASFQGTTLRELRLALDLQPGRTDLREASAILPGDAALSVQGALAPGPAFTGRIRLDAAELRAALPALRARFPALSAPLWAAMLPHQAHLVATLQLDHAGLVLHGIAGTLDGSAIAGDVTAHLAERPTIALRLVADHFGLDPLLAAPPADPRHWPCDLDMHLELRQAELAGQVLDRVVLDGSEDAGGITLRTLQAGWQGLQGAVAFHLGADGTVEDGKALLVGPDAAPLRALLPADRAGPPGLWHNRLDAALSFAGPPAALAGPLHIVLGNVTLDATPSLDLAAGRITGSLTLQHPSAARLLAHAGLPGIGPFLGEGSLSLIAQAALTRQRLALDQMTLGAGLLRAHGQVALTFGDHPALTGELAADTLPLLLPDPQSRALIDLSGLRAWRAELALTADTVQDEDGVLARQAAAQLVLAGGKLTLSGLRASVAGGTLQGTASLDAASDPAHLAAQLHLAGISLFGGLLSGDASATADGFSPAGFVATLGGAATLQMQGGTLPGMDAAALRAALAHPDPQDAVATALSGGGTPLQQASATLRAESGQVSVDASLETIGAAGGVGGTLDLPNESLDLAVSLRPDLPDGPTLAVRYEGAMASPGRSIDLTKLAAWLAKGPATAAAP